MGGTGVAVKLHLAGKSTRRMGIVRVNRLEKMGKNAPFFVIQYLKKFGIEKRTCKPKTPTLLATLTGSPVSVSLKNRIQTQITGPTLAIDLPAQNLGRIYHKTLNIWISKFCDRASTSCFI